MVAAWLALADIALPRRPQPWDPRLLWSAVALLAVTLVGALVISWVDRWRRRQGEAAGNAHDQLAGFRELYERGELSQEEYDRIRNRLNTRVRQEVNSAVPPPPAAGAPAALPPQPATGPEPPAPPPPEEGKPPG